MTLSDYFGRRNALDVEMARVRGILDKNAFNKAKGINSNAPHIQNAYQDLENVAKSYLELERQFWG